MYTKTVRFLTAVLILFLALSSSIAQAQPLKGIRGANLPWDAKMTSKDWVFKNKQVFIDLARETGIWPSITAAQVLQEVGMAPGGSAVYKGCTNIGGIKWGSLAKSGVFEGVSKCPRRPPSNAGHYIKFANNLQSLLYKEVLLINGSPYKKARPMLLDLSKTGAADRENRDKFLQTFGDVYCPPSGTDSCEIRYHISINQMAESFNLFQWDEEAFPGGVRHCAGIGENKVGDCTKYPGFKSLYYSSYTPGGGASPEGGGANGGSEVINEQDLPGMNKKVQVDKAEVDILDKPNLSEEEVARMESSKGLKETPEAAVTAFFGKAFSILGVLVLLWSVFLIAAGIFDQSNNFFSFSVLKLISGRTMVEHGETPGKGQVSWPKLFILSGIGFLVGIILVTGMMFDILYAIISHFQGVFE